MRIISSILTFAALTTFALATTCKDGSTCPGTFTCCKTPSGTGCCPYANAVCCSDGSSCCPNGYACDVARQQCKKNLNSDLFDLKLIKGGEIAAQPLSNSEGGF